MPNSSFLSSMKSQYPYHHNLKQLKVHDLFTAELIEPRKFLVSTLLIVFYFVNPISIESEIFDLHLYLEGNQSDQTCLLRHMN